MSHKHARDRAEKHKSCSFARLPHELRRQRIILSVICPLPSVRVRSWGFPQMGGCYLLKYNGGDSGIKISVLYWRCSLSRVSVIRGSNNIMAYLISPSNTDIGSSKSSLGNNVCPCCFVIILVITSLFCSCFQIVLVSVQKFSTKINEVLVRSRYKYDTWVCNWTKPEPLHRLTFFQGTSHVSLIHSRLLLLLLLAFTTHFHIHIHNII